MERFLLILIVYYQVALNGLFLADPEISPSVSLLIRQVGYLSCMLEHYLKVSLHDYRS